MGAGVSAKPISSESISVRRQAPISNSPAPSQVARRSNAGAFAKRWKARFWVASPCRIFAAGRTRSYFRARAETPSYKAWQGYAFEGVCLKHARADADASIVLQLLPRGMSTRRRACRPVTTRPGCLHLRT